MTAPSWLQEEHALSLLTLVGAAEAGMREEIPVGAVIADPWGRILACAGNRCLNPVDPSGHAEMRALRLAAARVANFRLPLARIAISLEPCPMCLAALSMARLETIRFAATRLPDGMPCQDTPREHASASAMLLRDFFQPKRENENARQNQAQR
ncbi:MAG: nucleoside deaminase [Magnetococcales bacterium]|nr:nucleoside deaminase [Magnetococcales bacterium]